MISAPFRCTLLADGSSDLVLQHHLRWLLNQLADIADIEFTFASFQNLPKEKKPRTFADRIELAARLYPCDVLFIHRDAEREPHSVRLTEIRNAIAQVQSDLPETVALVPVRMQEAWLLYDAQAIRAAAGNPNGKVKLRLPGLARVEALVDPKEELFKLLRLASGLSGRRLSDFKPDKVVHLVGEYIETFQPLIDHVSAFQALYQELHEVIKRQGWQKE